jgi:FADH2 O2-dependent halogenase
VRIAVDLAVAGSGFAGSLAALVARRLGLTVALIERGAHPRFAIGESTSPLANLLLEEIATRWDLPRLLPLCRWGSWRRAYPGVACGLKRGFSFYRHEHGLPFSADPLRRDQLLVGASPNDEVADTHWYRPDFDHFLVREAEAAGVEFLDTTAIERVEGDADGIAITGSRRGAGVFVRARLLVDATGPRGLAARVFAIPEDRFEALPETAGLYTHFAGVRRLEEALPAIAPEPPPYPPDDAALHHVFDGGWIWVLRFGNGVTSAGVAAEASLADELDLPEGGPAWDRLLERLPTVREQFEGSRALLPWTHRPRLAFRAKRASGPGWTMLPSAAAFVDPLLSTGFPLTLLGVERLGRALEEDWGSPRLAPRLAADAEKSLFETDAAALLVAALYASFADFPLFSELSKLYFAAASFSEAARRLGRSERASTFLCADDERYGRELAACCRAALRLPRGGRPADRQALFERIRAAITPLDVAGLTRTDRRGWYPFRSDDLVESAEKLGATAEEARELLDRSGLSAGSRSAPVT